MTEPAKVEPRTIVVTGATGFIGSALVEALRERGDSVVALSRDPERARAALGEVTVVAAELESPGSWTEALAGAAGVVHLAGESMRREALGRAAEAAAAREPDRGDAHAGRGDRALPAEARPRVLVSASGADYYGFAPDTEFDDDEVTERDPPSDAFLGWLCRDWEAEALAAERHGLRVVRMRTGVVLGPGGALAKMTTPFKLFAGGRIGSGRQWVAWIDRDDAVRGYLAALDDDRATGPLNLVADSARNADLAAAIGAALHRPSWLPVPGLALRAAVGELADYLLHGRRVVPAGLAALGFTWTRPTLAAALADLER